MKGIESLPSWSREKTKVTVQLLSSVDASIVVSGTSPDLPPQKSMSNFADIQRPLTAPYCITLKGMVACKEGAKPQPKCDVKLVDDNGS